MDLLQEDHAEPSLAWQTKARNHLVHLTQKSVTDFSPPRIYQRKFLTYFPMKKSFSFVTAAALVLAVVVYSLPAQAPFQVHLANAQAALDELRVYAEQGQFPVASNGFLPVAYAGEVSDPTEDEEHVAELVDTVEEELDAAIEMLS